MKENKRLIFWTTVLLVLIHQAGLIGLNLDASRAWFTPLIPLNLLLCITLLLLFHRGKDLRFGVFSFVIFWAGYLIEVLGVSTGWIFGTYAYGEVLGFKVGNTPPLIGINWLMLTICAGVIVQDLPGGQWARAAAGAALMTFLDLLIEPMAMEYGMWSWAGDRVPLHNYLGWYIVSFFMQLGFHSLGRRQENPIAVPLYILQAFFFFCFILIRWQ